MVPGCQKAGLLGEWNSVEKECRMEWAVFIHMDELLGSSGDESAMKGARFFKIDFRGVSMFFMGELGTMSSEKVTTFLLRTGDDEGGAMTLLPVALIGDRLSSSEGKGAGPELVFLLLLFRSGSSSSSSGVCAIGGGISSSVKSIMGDASLESWEVFFCDFRRLGVDLPARDARDDAFSTRERVLGLGERCWEGVELFFWFLGGRNRGNLAPGSRLGSLCESLETTEVIVCGKGGFSGKLPRM